jgi:hypothetical protein
MNVMMQLRWDYKAHREIPNSPYTQREWIQTLQTKINECTNWLHTNMEGIDWLDVNTIITSTTGFLLFEEMSMFSFDPNTYGRDNFLGVLGGRYVVTTDENIMDDSVYVGTATQPQLCKIFIDNLRL